MAITFPTTLDNLTNPTTGQTLAVAGGNGHTAQHSDLNDAVEALEAKLGADASVVTTSHDYKLSGVTGTDKAASKTGSETLTNKTLTSPKVNMGSDATGDMYYRDNTGTLVRLPIGTSGQIIDVSSGGIPEWIANPSASDASTTIKGVVQEATQAQVSAGTAAGSAARLFVNPATYKPLMSVHTNFEATGRFTLAATGAGTNPAVSTTGMSLVTGGTAGSSSFTWDVGGISGNGNLFSSGGRFHAFVGSVGTTAGTASAYVGLGTVTVASTGHTFTTNHIGFKLLVSGGVISLYGTVGNGSTETATSALTTIGLLDTLQLFVAINAATVDFYWRKNNSALSTVTSVSTNIPSTASQQLQGSISNDNTANSYTFKIQSMAYDI